jgi:hypothetical protein
MAYRFDIVADRESDVIDHVVKLPSPAPISSVPIAQDILGQAGRGIAAT